MQKKGQTGPMSWRTRWFVLQDSTLYYYTSTQVVSSLVPHVLSFRNLPRAWSLSSQDTKAKGKIDLKFSSVIEDPSSKTGFIISTPTREWHLYTDSEEGELIPCPIRLSAFAFALPLTSHSTDKQDWMGALMNHGSFLAHQGGSIPQ